MNEDLSVLRTWFHFVLADAELAGEPLKDDDILLNYSGNGASCFVTVGNMKRAVEEPAK